jgi:ubiquinone/menaquinone biosynthesis C-methylase UbiE
MVQKSNYVPALSLPWLTKFYDRLVEGPMSVLRMRQGVLNCLGDLAGKSALDVGCGTGTFVIMMKQAYPNSDISGLDGDPNILDIARTKAAGLGMNIHFSQAMSYAMPYPDGSFDFVVTSLMLHHLSKDSKQKTAAEMFRVLKCGGQLIGVDFAEPRGPLGRSLKPFTRHFERVAENLDGLLPVIIGGAGFEGYREVQRYVLGSIALFRATKLGGTVEVV